METETLNTLPMLVRMLVALATVVALMGGLAFVMKKFGLSGAQPKNQGKNTRLQVIERLPLDTRRHLVIIGCDETEHLVILGPNGETVLQTDLTTRPTPTQKPAKQPKTTKAKKDKAA